MLILTSYVSNWEKYCVSKFISEIKKIEKNKRERERKIIFFLKRQIIIKEKKMLAAKHQK